MTWGCSGTLRHKWASPGPCEFRTSSTKPHSEFADEVDAQSRATFLLFVCKRSCSIVSTSSASIIKLLRGQVGCRSDWLRWAIGSDCLLVAVSPSESALIDSQRSSDSLSTALLHSAAQASGGRKERSSTQGPSSATRSPSQRCASPHLDKLSRLKAVQYLATDLSRRWRAIRSAQVRTVLQWPIASAVKCGSL